MFYTVLITTSEVIMERTDKDVYSQVYKSFTCGNHVFPLHCPLFTVEDHCTCATGILLIACKIR